MKSNTHLSIYQSNINGLNSKADSLFNIINLLSPDILVICELKTKSVQNIQKQFKKINYSIIIQKESGIMIAAKLKHKLINVTSCNHPNILTGQLTLKDLPVRIIATYGLQESCPMEERCNFFDEVSIELENCVLHRDNPIIIGDLNAKIEMSQKKH